MIPVDGRSGPSSANLVARQLVLIDAARSRDPSAAVPILKSTSGLRRPVLGSRDFESAMREVVAGQGRPRRARLTLDFSAVEELLTTQLREGVTLRASGDDEEIRVEFPDRSRLVVQRRPRDIWRPSRSGPLTDDDLAEASILLDALGDWIAQLPDDDPRLRQAEVAQLTLRAQITLEDEADRIILRRTVETLTALMGPEVRAAVAEATSEVEPEIAEPLREAVDAVVSAAEGDDEESWSPGLDQVDTALDLLVASLPPSNSPPNDRVGRGKVLAKVAGKEGSLALLRAGAVELVRAGWRLALHLITNWM